MACRSLLRLPVELLRNVTEYLEIQDQARLSMTNRYLRSTLPAPSLSDFLKAEASEWAVSKQLYTCNSCVRFRGLLQFADDMRKGARARSASDARSRFCLECGVKQGLYLEGTHISIYGQPAVLGRLCSDLTDHCGHEASCGSQALAWTRLTRSRHLTHDKDHRDARDDDWAYISRSSVGTRRAEEEYGLWLDL